MPEASRASPPAVPGTSTAAPAHPLRAAAALGRVSNGCTPTRRRAKPPKLPSPSRVPGTPDGAAAVLGVVHRPRTASPDGAPDGVGGQGRRRARSPWGSAALGQFHLGWPAAGSRVAPLAKPSALRSPMPNVRPPTDTAGDGLGAVRTAPSPRRRPQPQRGSVLLPSAFNVRFSRPRVRDGGLVEWRRASGRWGGRTSRRTPDRCARGAAVRGGHQRSRALHRSTIGIVAHFLGRGGAPAAERAVILAPGRPADLLPCAGGRWRPGLPAPRSTSAATRMP